MKLSFRAAAALCLLLLVSYQTPAGAVNAQGVVKGATVGTSSAQVVRAGAAQIYLMFYNPSAPGGNTVYCAENATAVANAAGTIGIAPGQYFTMEASLVDGGAWNCIATGINTPFTYGAQ